MYRKVSKHYMKRYQVKGRNVFQHFSIAKASIVPPIELDGVKINKAHKGRRIQQDHQLIKQIY